MTASIDGLLADDDRVRRVRRARSVVGRYRSGHTGTSVSHDDVYAASILE